MVGIENDADGEVSVFVLAKQMRHFPPNKGLWLGSKSLPHSLQMLDKSSTWWTLEWWRSSSIVRKVLLQTPHVNPAAAVDVAVSPRKYKIGMTILCCVVISRGELILYQNELIPLFTFTNIERFVWLVINNPQHLTNHFLLTRVQ